MTEKPKTTTAAGKKFDGFTDEERAALTELTADDEARISALARRAAS
ncbi:hypothetical protein [Streptosporangium lutulentum]|uniref:Transposase-like protein n=1 Tax=Streptosporangium lutulentum TaxID=1461250 RepID=A0ABT9QMU5_9ACTN|nr:hypothetical protein [Streptosporangium lutulentum]MDP9847239.1 transposase-like protein [Streptosporangium lutulentum]